MNIDVIEPGFMYIYRTISFHLLPKFYPMVGHVLTLICTDSLHHFTFFIKLYRFSFKSYRKASRYLQFYKFEKYSSIKFSASKKIVAAIIYYHRYFNTISTLKKANLIGTVFKNFDEYFWVMIHVAIAILANVPNCSFTIFPPFAVYPIRSSIQYSQLRSNAHSL